MYLSGVILMIGDWTRMDVDWHRRMTKEQRQARWDALWKDFVLYMCDCGCGSGIWYLRSDYMPDSFPQGRPCFGTMVRQQMPQFWQEEAE